MTAETSAYETARARLNAEWEEVRIARAVLDAQSARLRERSEQLTVQRLDAITDEQIMADEDLRRWLCRTSYGDSAAHKRQSALMARYHEAISAEGYDARDEYIEDILPVPRIRLEQDSDIPAVAAALASWLADWSLGRSDVRIGVFEHTLSEYGSYAITWMPGGEPEARLTKTTYGSERDVPKAAGDLASVLAYVALHHPYTDPNPDSRW